ncbi:MAG: 4-hydroxy-tetrahydrodipicolinate reductase [Clostridiales bacterium]|nr:4-hydroxy-tetrahydrodipicolinate reductase [Clostridiales bacterium]
MIKVLVYDSNGTMGKILDEEISINPNLNLAVGVSHYLTGNEKYLAFPSLKSVNVDFDVIIDFSHFSLTDNLIEYALNQKKPLVIATTGLSDKQESKIKDASKIIPIFRAKNFSLGINLMAHLIQEAQKLLSDFDIEIIEKHHNKKVDAPSGTAFLLADSLNKNNEYIYQHGRYGKSSKRDSKEIGIHSLRGGTIVGEHSVIFAGTDEVIEFKHEAHSKKVFAKGAIKAAEYLINQKNGLFNMNDLIKGGQ